MKLTKKDKEYLKKHGYRDEDFRQISESAGFCVLRSRIYGKRERRISRSAALGMLGREKLLSGYARAAFHWSAVQCPIGEDGREDPKNAVYFDSSKYFKW